MSFLTEKINMRKHWCLNSGFKHRAVVCVQLPLNRIQFYGWEVQLLTTEITWNCNNLFLDQLFRTKGWEFTEHSFLLLSFWFKSPLQNICSEHCRAQHHCTKYLIFLLKHTIYLPFDVDTILQHRISCDALIMKPVRYAVILSDNHHFKITLRYLD